MSKVKFKLNYQGVKEFLRCENMRNVTKSYGNQMVSKLGNEYGAETYQGFDRVQCYVFPKTEKAKKDNLDSNTILKASR